MKKIYIISLAVTLSLIAINVNAATTSNTNDAVKVKNLGNKYIRQLFADQNQAANKTLNEMSALGANNFKTMEYLPCPYRGNIQIAGKSIDAKSKRCFTLKYTYNNKHEEVGQCKANSK